MFLNYSDPQKRYCRYYVKKRDGKPVPYKCLRELLFNAIIEIYSDISNFLPYAKVRDNSIPVVITAAGPCTERFGMTSLTLYRTLNASVPLFTAVIFRIRLIISVWYGFVNISALFPMIFTKLSNLNAILYIIYKHKENLSFYAFLLTLWGEYNNIYIKRKLRGNSPFL